MDYSCPTIVQGLVLDETCVPLALKLETQIYV